MRAHLLTRARRYLGARRSAMLTIATFAACVGATLYHDAGTEYREQSVLFAGLPVTVRVAGWVATSVIAAIIAVWAPPRIEWAGWVALAVMPFERIFSYTWAALMWAIPDDPDGTPWAIAYAIQWSCAVVLLRVISSWREDSEQRLEMTRHDQPPPMEP